MAVCSPMPLVLAGFGVEYDNAVVPVTVRHVNLVRLRVHKRLGRQPKVVYVVAPLAASRLADLHQELPGFGELQDHVVVERLNAGNLSFFVGSSTAAAPPSRTLRASA